MATKYRMSFEFIGPDKSDRFSPAIFELKIKKYITALLSEEENFRLSQLQKLYKLETIELEHSPFNEIKL